MSKFDLRLPEFRKMSSQEDIWKLNDYMYQLNESLQVAFSNIDGENLSGDVNDNINKIPQIEKMIRDANGVKGQPGPRGPKGEPGDSEYIKVEDYGAKGDGVTDDTVAFREAITHCQEEGKGLLIGNKSYVITDRLTITNPINIAGSGIESSVLKFTTLSIHQTTPFDNTWWDESNALFSVKCNNVNFSNFTIQGLEGCQWNGFIFHYPHPTNPNSYAAGERITITDVNVSKMKNGIFVFAGWNRKFERMYITDCSDSGIKYESLMDTLNWSCSGDIIEACYLVGCHYGLYLDKTFEMDILNCILEYNQVPIYCFGCLDTVFTNCWNEANHGNIYVSGNARFVNGYNVNQNTIDQNPDDANGVVMIEKPAETIGLRNGDIVFYQIGGIITKGVSLGSQEINLLPNPSFGTIANPNLDGWIAEAASIMKVREDVTYNGANSVFFNFNEGWGSNPYYGLKTNVMTLDPGTYTFKFHAMTPDRSTIDDGCAFYVFKTTAEGTITYRYIDTAFSPASDNIWEEYSGSFTTTESVYIIPKIQVNRNGLLYVSAPVLCSADISSDSLSIKKNEEDEHKYRVVDQSGVNTGDVYTSEYVDELISGTVIQGPKGDKGDKGDTGAQGPAGADGKTPTMIINSSGHLIAIFD